MIGSSNAFIPARERPRNGHCFGMVAFDFGRGEMTRIPKFGEPHLHGAVSSPDLRRYLFDAGAVEVHIDQIVDVVKTPSRLFPLSHG